MRAESDGLLDSKEKVREYLPELNILGDLTISELYHHTSGIYDIVCDDSLTKNYISLSRFFEILVEKGIKARGSFNYCTTNYTLLWIILTRIHSKSVPEIIEEQICSLVPEFSLGYDNDIRNESDFSESSDIDELLTYCENVKDVPGATLIYCSATNLGRLLRFLVNGKIVEKIYVQRMIDNRQEVEQGLAYGIGFFCMNNDIIGHGGTAGNYRSAITYDRKNDLILVRCSRIQNPPESEPLTDLILEKVYSVIKSVDS